MWNNYKEKLLASWKYTVSFKESAEWEISSRYKSFTITKFIRTGRVSSNTKIVGFF